MPSKKTLVLGASTNRFRYSNTAINMLREYNHEVVAVGRDCGKVADVEIKNEMENFEGIDTVTLYLNPQNQEIYKEYILSLHPKRVIFNPGSENDAFEKLLEANNIQPIEACTLVMLRTNQY